MQREVLSVLPDPLRRQRLVGNAQFSVGEYRRAIEYYEQIESPTAAKVRKQLEQWRKSF